MLGVRSSRQYVVCDGRSRTDFISREDLQTSPFGQAYGLCRRRLLNEHHARAPSLHTDFVPPNQFLTCWVIRYALKTPYRGGA
jgi:hypothetical protein